jgi:hypothetical protein
LPGVGRFGVIGLVLAVLVALVALVATGGLAGLLLVTALGVVAEGKVTMDGVDA